MNDFGGVYIRHNQADSPQVTVRDVQKPEYGKKAEVPKMVWEGR